MSASGWATAQALHDPVHLRQAGADLLSLALMDARNRTLRWLAAFEGHPTLLGGSGHPSSPLVLIGRAGWFQEFWIARHVQRLRGAQADPAAARLPSIEPRADAWFDPRETAPESGLPETLRPDVSAVRAYLAQTLETTLELLAGADGSDAALHPFRLALWHEDGLAEDLAVSAWWHGVPAPDDLRPGPALGRAAAGSLGVPPSTVSPGTPVGGLVPAWQRQGEPQPVPGFEIDAQAVTWAQFVEFAEDGGYDDTRWWTPAGWAWVQAEGRRAPRGVEQLRGAVLARRGAGVTRLAARQAVTHVSWYEAQAWCRWAGRRLPLEIEWEHAARSAAARGFRWGEVQEWVDGPARAWPGAATDPVAGFDPLPSTAGSEPARCVLRGASRWTVPRAADPCGRRFADPRQDDGFFGFRSVAG